VKNPAADRPFWDAEVNTSVKGRRSGYRVPLVSAAAGAKREGAVIRRQRDHVRYPGRGDIAMGAARTRAAP
jgi:hypothetical protein